MLAIIALFIVGCFAEDLPSSGDGASNDGCFAGSNGCKWAVIGIVFGVVVFGFMFAKVHILEEGRRLTLSKIAELNHLDSPVIRAGFETGRSASPIAAGVESTRIPTPALIRFTALSQAILPETPNINASRSVVIHLIPPTKFPPPYEEIRS
ncbi:hypothetical protein FRC03_010201 [Tulasnella sp. 419]|nr:hypothetical protein FRC02_003635 [Tulasnella sp. 418]KAG8957390.1 hypothetical protein FRC03_010201 [Tulasnella sp. 419]